MMQCEQSTCVGHHEIKEKCLFSMVYASELIPPG